MATDLSLRCSMEKVLHAFGLKPGHLLALFPGGKYTGNTAYNVDQ